ncbi:uncharacterized protein LOC110685269 [Chenopodium quinoa]|uniref:uncharacterized protein LOC110685269 n=1 Tax=Chenopodium quinoa TaxID=63459 RepID=UPI000B787FA0|nr:uncharacterized protein LOC110685269 [Chenopodium quinoa]
MKHRLCMWHIMRKVPEKVGTTFGNVTDFLKELYAIVWDKEIEPNQFVDGWNTYAQRHEQDEQNRQNKHMPKLITPLKLEKHGYSVYTRSVFYEFQQESKAAYFSYGVESCNSTYGDGVEFSVVVDNERKSVSEIPKHYVLNRWRKDVKKKPTSADEASNFDKKKQLIFNVWSKMFFCVSLAKGCDDDLSDFVNFKEGKEASIQLFVGSNVVDVDILPPSQCLNKRSTRSYKRLKSVKEVQVE